VAGYNTFNTVSVRLWSAYPMFNSQIAQNKGDLEYLLKQIKDFKEEDHYKNIIEMRKECEKITCVPYPKDPGQPLSIQELSLKQQYFYVSATLKDILRRFMKKNQHNWDRLPSKMQLYLLDIHHSIAILEMLRILIDDFQLTFQQAFLITK